MSQISYLHEIAKKRQLWSVLRDRVIVNRSFVVDVKLESKHFLILGLVFIDLECYNLDRSKSYRYIKLGHRVLFIGVKCNLFASFSVALKS